MNLPDISASQLSRKLRDIPSSLMERIFKAIILNIQASLFREYYNLCDNKTAYVNKLHKDLRIVFPSYSKVFSNLTGKTSLLILKTYKTPTALLNAPKDDIVSLIAATSRKGLKYANKKYHKLIQAA